MSCFTLSVQSVHTAIVGLQGQNDGSGTLLRCSGLARCRGTNSSGSARCRKLADGSWEERV